MHEFEYVKNKIIKCYYFLVFEIFNILFIQIKSNLGKR